MTQDALYGSINRLSTYFENLNVSSVNLKLNGRDVLTEPIKVKIAKDAGGTDVLNTEVMGGFLTIAEVLNHIGDPSSPLRLDYNSYMLGSTIFAIELNKCGKSGGSTGALDLEVIKT